MVHGKHDMGSSVCFLDDWTQNMITIYASHCVAFLGKTLTVHVPLTTQVHKLVTEN